jgi:hypothetical protein
LSIDSDGVVVYESDEEADDCESSKLVWVGVDRDEVGESPVKNCGISVKFNVKSVELSWTNEGKKSQLLRSNRVVGEGDEVDIKSAGCIAEADGPGDSAFIVRLRGGVGVYLQVRSGVCVEGVITGWGIGDRA